MQGSLAVAALLLALALLLAACAGSSRLAPVSSMDPTAETTPEAHTVRKGDTLYAIAWEYDLDYRTLAAWNRLEPPFVIYPGQVLRLRGSTPAMADDSVKATVTIAALPDTANVGHRKIDEGKVGAASASPAESGSDAGNDSGTGSVAETTQNKTLAALPDTFDGGSAVTTWHWPTRGKIIGAFGKSGEKGIHLSGTFEQPVVAAADGRVVYSGTGLVGYGRLIVLKHNKQFFSAYGHNSRILVEEGEVVRGGQRIAQMGSSGSDRVKLHFEIRRNGKPVDPLRFLPRQRT